MVTIEFLITSLIVVLIPGTGVIYTLSIGLTSGRKASIFAAIGCTAGIIPHLLASILGLAALLHISSTLFEIVKFLGVLYLLYLAWSMWRSEGAFTTHSEGGVRSYLGIAIRGLLINILNPKLSLFFLAFMPQFLSSGSGARLDQLLLLSAIFMGITLIVFALYGTLASTLRQTLLQRKRTMLFIQRSFAGLFALIAGRLAMSEN